MHHIDLSNDIKVDEAVVKRYQCNVGALMG